MTFGSRITRFLFTLGAVIFIATPMIWAAGCGEEETTGTTGDKASTSKTDAGKKVSGDKPGTSGADVYKFVKQTDDFTKWSLFPGKGEFYTGAEAHGELRTTYVSDGALKAIQDKAGTIPDGEMIVKQSFDPGKTPTDLVVMYKVKGFNPDGGDWFWAKYKADGSVTAEGKVQGCLDCHGQKKDNDWVMSGAIK